MRVASILAVSVLLLLSALSMPLPSRGQDESLVVRIGDLGELRSRNPLGTSLHWFGDADDWGAGILQPIYSHPLLRHFATRELEPYIAKGIDANGNGTFDPGEYGAFGMLPVTNASDIIVYFDFNGVRWHDGIQMTVMDLLFSLQIEAMRPDFEAYVRPLMDRGGGPASNFTHDRWLAVSLTPKSWAGEAGLLGDPGLRVAVRFRLQVPYQPFFEITLADLWLLPRHVWEETGGMRHGDFGRAVFPEGDPRAGQGIPVTETLYSPFDLAAATGWQPRDADVIGSGPFCFSTWVAGIHARIDRNPTYFVGADPDNAAVVYDPRIAAILHRPSFEGVEFLPYRTQLGRVAAIEAGEIDLVRGSFPVEATILIQKDAPGVRVWAAGDRGLVFLAYNMRRPWLGYNNTQGGDAADAGRPLRAALSHLVDRDAIVRILLQGYGVAMDSVVSPATTFWYNASLNRIPYDPARAVQILDSAGWPDPGGACLEDGTGCRSLPMVGTQPVEILTTTADVDPVRASAERLIVTAARSVGLNVRPGRPLFDPVDPRAEFRRGSFDLAILRAGIDGTDPDYLFALLHSTGKANDAGYRDPVFDDVVERARRAGDPSERQRFVRQAQGLAMDDRPVEPLYSATLIEATQNRFSNWTEGYRGLWNFWSWIGARSLVAPRPPLRIEIDNPGVVGSGAITVITVVARNKTGAPVQGVIVTIRINEGDGGQFIGGAGGEITGPTGNNGDLDVRYEAPVVAWERYVHFLVSAHDASSGSTATSSFLLLVVPPGTAFLSLRVSLPGGDLTIAGAPLPVRVELRDEFGDLVGDAHITGGVVPAGGTLEPISGRSDRMRNVLFVPPGAVTADTDYQVSFDAEKPGYPPTRAIVSILVVPETAGPVPPTSPPDALLPIIGVVGATAALATVAIAWLIRGRSRR